MTFDGLIGVKFEKEWEPKVSYALPYMTPIDPYLGISGQKRNKKSLFLQTEVFTELMFLKFTRFMCSCSPHFRFKFGEIRFINQSKTSLRSFPQISRVPSAKNKGRTPKQ